MSAAKKLSPVNRPAGAKALGRAAAHSGVQKVAIRKGAQQHPTVHQVKLGSGSKQVGKKSAQGHGQIAAWAYQMAVGPFVDRLIAAVDRQLHPAPETMSTLRHEFERLASAVAGTEAGEVLSPPGDRVLRTQEAADLIGISRPFLVSRIDAGEIPLFQQVGNQRRVLESDVRRWHEKSRAQQRDAMRQLAGQIDDEYED